MYSLALSHFNRFLLVSMKSKRGAGMRLIRTILVLSGAGFLLPSPPEDVAVNNVSATTEQVSTLAMLSSASSAVTDVAGFCFRQPDFCESASYVAGRLEAKAKYSVKLLYEWASEAESVPSGEPEVTPAQPDVIKVDLMKTGTIVADNTVPVTHQAKNQSTLKLEDLIPEWRGPAVSKQLPKKQG